MTAITNLEKQTLTNLPEEVHGWSGAALAFGLPNGDQYILIAATPASLARFANNDLKNPIKVDENRLKKVLVIPQEDFE